MESGLYERLVDAGLARALDDLDDHLIAHLKDVPDADLRHVVSRHVASALVRQITPELANQILAGLDDEDLGDGDQVVASEPPHLTFDAALLVGAGDAGLAIERLEPVMRAERGPTVSLDPLPAEPDDARHGRFEIVVADLADWHTTQTSNACAWPSKKAS